MDGKTTMRLKITSAAVFACACIAAATMCADETKQNRQSDAGGRAPLRLETKNVVQPRGPLAYLHASVEMQDAQPDIAAGLTATVIVRNEGVESLELVNPAITAKMELTASDGRVLEVVPAAPSQHTLGAASVVTLESGGEHRFPVVVREVIERPAAAAAGTAKAASPKDNRPLPEIDTMSSSTAPPQTAEAASTPPHREPLGAGRYRVRLTIGLAAPTPLGGATLPVRYLTTDPVTVSYGMN